MALFKACNLPLWAPYDWLRTWNFCFPVPASNWCAKNCALGELSFFKYLHMFFFHNKFPVLHSLSFVFFFLCTLSQGRLSRKATDNRPQFTSDSEEFKWHHEIIWEPRHVEWNCGKACQNYQDGTPQACFKHQRSGVRQIMIQIMGFSVGKLHLGYEARHSGRPPSALISTNRGP